MKLNGIFPALTTPFASDGALDLEALRANISRYDSLPLAGYVVIGSTGESVFLNRGEIAEILRAVREAAAPGKILIAGTGAESTAETISRTAEAAHLGYHCALVKTPHFYQPMMTPESYIKHYQRVADASPIPVLLYSVPRFTGVALRADVVGRLAEHRNIIGMKDSSGNIGELGAILASAPGAFQLLTGAAYAVYPSMALGAKGAILAVADFLPEMCLELYSAVVANDAAGARELQRRVSIAARSIAGPFGISGVKYAMDCRGYRGGAVRNPLLPLADAQKRSVEAVLSTVASTANHAG
jgi:4-hydroxy-2-oxoglutarate aldolase